MNSLSTARLLALLALAPSGSVHALAHPPQEATAQEASAADAVRPLVSSLFLHPERLNLRDGSWITIERGVLVVPVVRAQPDSKPISVEVYRFRAQEGADPNTPPRFELHGGPGWEGLGPVLSAPGGYEQQIEPMTAISDVVVVGQRGIGSSVPNTSCRGFEEGIAEDTPDEEAVRQACTACRDYWAGQGYDLSGFNVIEAAADVDDVRRHLGYDRITLTGGSFGSHWAMAVMRYHPQGVARAVLNGMEGPDHTYDMPSGVLGALEKMAAQAEASPALRDDVPEDGLIEALRFLAESLDESPVELEVRDPETRRMVPFAFDGDAVRDVAMGYSDRVNSRRGVASWPADVIRLYRGEFDRPAQLLADRRAGDNGSIPTASFFLLDCGSGITAEREARLNADPAAQVLGNMSAFYQQACPVWGVDLGDDFRTGFTTDIPTVIVHGTWDVSTPFDNALELLGSFQDHHFVVVEGGTHGALREALGHSSEFRRELTEFLASGDREGLPDTVTLPPIQWQRVSGS